MFFSKNFDYSDPHDLHSISANHDALPRILLTFDDGLKDHYKFVLPVLENLGIKACFFVNSLIYERQVLLDVHRIHLLLSKVGSRNIWDAVTSKFDTKASRDIYEKELATRYTHQKIGSAEKWVKFFLNYQANPEDRETFLRDQIHQHFGDERKLCVDFYLQPHEIVELRDRGHRIGAHSHSHFVLANESLNSQRREIKKNKGYLEDLLNEQVTFFAYPFGRALTYNCNTVESLKEFEFEFAFAMRHEDVSSKLINEQPLELPRYDCNVFPHGTATTNDCSHC